MSRHPTMIVVKMMKMAMMVMTKMKMVEEVVESSTILVVASLPLTTS